MKSVFAIVTKLIASNHFCFEKSLFCNNFGRDGKTENLKSASYLNQNESKKNNLRVGVG